MWPKFGRTSDFCNGFIVFALRERTNYNEGSVQTFLEESECRYHMVEGLVIARSENLQRGGVWAFVFF